MTRSTSSQTSVTPGFAFILSSFLLLSPASALPAHAFASDGDVQEKNVTIGKREDPTLTAQQCQHGTSVNLSLTYYQLINPGSSGPDPGSSSNTSHTPSHFPTQTQIFDRQGPKLFLYRQEGKCAKMYYMPSSCKCEEETVHTNGKYLRYIL